MYYIGIDIGTTSVKALAMDQKGKVVASASGEYPLDHPKPLWSEQSPLHWWKETCAAIKTVTSSLEGKVEAVSFSGQMHGLVMLDHEDAPIRPAILWNDQRSFTQCDFLNQTIGQKKVSDWTGNMALAGFTAPKILWVQEHEPENWNRATKVMLPKDYIAYKLSGCFATDVSDASGTLYFDVAARKWSAPMMELLKLRPDQLPAVFESSQSIGTVRRELAAELGLQPETRVVIGGGDQAVAAVGGGVVGEAACSVSLGTSGVVFATADHYHADPENRLHSFCHGNGRYHQMGVTLAAAASLKWWAEEIQSDSSYDVLLAEAEQVQDSKNLFFLPYLMGERTPHNDSNCRGTFIGLDLTHKRGHMTRAVLEGVAFSLRDTFEIMRQMDLHFDEISISGGGSQSELWCQIIADVLDVKVNRLAASEGPAYGAAILAAVGSGLFATVEEACGALIKVQSTLEADPGRAKDYTDQYKRYHAIYPATRDLFVMLNAN